MNDIVYTVWGYDSAIEQLFSHSEFIFDRAKEVYDEYAKHKDVFDLHIREYSYMITGTVERIIYYKGLNVDITVHKIKE